MIEYKEKIYSSYKTIHYSNIYLPNTLTKIEHHFRSWDYYFGKLLPPEKKARIVDLGCGDGNFVYYLQKRGYENVRGFDFSRELIEYGTELGIKNLEVNSLDSILSNSEAEFDVIIIRDVLEHLEAPIIMETLAKACSRLSTKGMLLLQVPNGEGLYFSSIFYGDFTHSTAFSRSSLMQIGLASGFSRISCFQMEPPPVSVAGRIRNLLWRIKILNHRFWKFIATGYSKGVFTENIICAMHK